MPGPGEVTMGRAHVDPSGKKPTRIGLNTGGLDMQDTGTKIQEATLASAQNKPRSSIKINQKFSQLLVLCKQKSKHYKLMLLL